MIFKKITLCSLLLFTGSIQTNDNLARNITIGVVAAGSTFLLTKAWAKHVVKHAQTQFTPERQLLNQYAHYNGHHWTTDAEEALKRDLKTRIVHLHNSNRGRCSLGILYDMYAGNPAVYVSNNFHTFPLLQHVDDLDWYIKRLYIIRCLHLYSDRNELNLLLDQLEYIKNMLISDHDYNIEEQHYN